ncbi:unnamed protein product [Closterium sp. NIES-65]|nr:unnamed protein product [Closterium sp. NIES-65]
MVAPAPNNKTPPRGVRAAGAGGAHAGGPGMGAGRGGRGKLPHSSSVGGPDGGMRRGVGAGVEDPLADQFGRSMTVGNKAPTPRGPGAGRGAGGGGQFGGGEPEIGRSLTATDGRHRSPLRQNPHATGGMGVGGMITPRRTQAQQMVAGGGRGGMGGMGGMGAGPGSPYRQRAGSGFSQGGYMEGGGEYTDESDGMYGEDGYHQNMQRSRSTGMGMMGAGGRMAGGGMAMGGMGGGMPPHAPGGRGMGGGRVSMGEEHYYTSDASEGGVGGGAYPRSRSVNPRLEGAGDAGGMAPQGKAGKAEVDPSELPMLPPPGSPQVVQARALAHLLFPWHSERLTPFPPIPLSLPNPHPSSPFPLHLSPSLLLFSRPPLPSLLSSRLRPFTSPPPVSALLSAIGIPSSVPAGQEGHSEAALQQVHARLTPSLLPLSQPLPLLSPLHPSFSLLLSPLSHPPLFAPSPHPHQCQRCSQLLEVPAALPPAKKGIQKLRCGKCMRVSRFRVNPADPRTAAAAAAAGGVSGGEGFSDNPDVADSGSEYQQNDYMQQQQQQQQQPPRYDQVAGFWGEMGGPCLGIIPPGIEFGTPIPVDCAGGATRVYVNGRELHKKDLDRLMKRGLPSKPNMSYRVEINGSVYDEETGDYLLSLGKLAPS